MPFGQQASAHFPIPTTVAPFVVDDDDNHGFDPAPLPVAWNLNGDASPEMRFTAMSSDGDLSSGIWACGPGVFRFDFNFDEFIHIISGTASIRSSDGVTQHLEPGSTAYFPRGLSTVWTVDDHIRKFFVIRNPPRAVRIARRVGEQLTSLRSIF